MTISAETGILRVLLLPSIEGDRLGKEIMLPGDCQSITGLQTVVWTGPAATSYLAAQPLGNNQAGHLSLRWSGLGDIIHQEKVTIPRTFNQNPYTLKFGLGFGLASLPDFWHSGRILSPVNLVLPGPGRMIRLYYKDTIAAQVGQSEVYAVAVFLHYQKHPQR